MIDQFRAFTKMVLVGMDEEVWKAIEKRAKGYEYEETQTLIVETKSGVKKQVIKYKRHMPADIEAAKLVIGRSKRERIADLEKEIRECTADIWKTK